MGAAAQASTVAEPNAAADAECVYAIMSESRARPRFSREDNGFDQSHTSKSCYAPLGYVVWVRGSVLFQS